jgi:hypothetical protein
MPNPDVMNSYKWELYDLTKDWTQDNDLAAANPGKLREMQELFMVEAAKFQVFPLDNSLATRMVTPRPSVTAGRNVFTYSGELGGRGGAFTKQAHAGVRLQVRRARFRYPGFQQH